MEIACFSGVLKTKKNRRCSHSSNTFSLLKKKRIIVCRRRHHGVIIDFDEGSNFSEAGFLFAIYIEHYSRTESIFISPLGLHH